MSTGATNGGPAVPIDGGARYLARDVARDAADAVARVIPELLGRCPPDAYLCRVIAAKDMQRGARFNVQAIYQKRGMDYETRSERARRDAAL